MGEEALADTGAMERQKITGSVVALWRYPVSSLAGEALNEAQLTPNGLAGDRTHGIYDEETDLIVYPARDTRWNAAPLIHAKYDGKGDVTLSLDGRTWVAPDDADAMARIAETLGRPVRLRAYGSQTSQGIAAPRYKQNPIHLLSLQAMETLRRLLPQSVIDERRFRPNILIDLPDAAGDIPEYALLGQDFTIGGLRLRGTIPCGRCGFTNLQQENLPEDPQVLRTLVKQFERNFGIYCDIIDEGPIACGDVVSADFPDAPIDPVVIVGAGQAGAMAARALRRHGYEGKIRLIGEERHAPYERPPLSKSIFETSGSIARVPVLTPAEASELKIDFHLGTQVMAIDRDRSLLEMPDGSIMSYGRLILATGGMARRMPGLDRGFGRVHILRTIEDAEAFARSAKSGSRVFVNGGGWIGMEVAAAARKAGCEVTLFARTERLAPRILPQVVSTHMEALHAGNGVMLRFGAEPRFREEHDAVYCQINGKTEAADILVVAIGMVAHDGLARRAGLDCDDGILTDANGATSHPQIFAIGDVARQSYGAAGDRMRIESWQNANDQADRAARAILRVADDAPQPMRFWSDQFGHRLQIVGLPDPKAQQLQASGDEGALFWDFGSFAIGIDCPEKMHRFARNLEQRPVESIPQRVTDAADIDPTRFSSTFLMDAESLPEAAIRKIETEGFGAVLLTRLDGRIFAVDDRCPHAVASLAEGFVEDGRIVCPLHFAEFDLVDGTPHNAPAGCGHLTCYTVMEQDGQIFLLTPKEPASPV